MSDNVNVSAPAQSSPQQAAASNTSAQATQAASTPTQAPQAKPPEAELYDVKVNGKTIKMTRQELIDHASMSHAANSKFEEAAKQRKQVEKIIQTAKSNPIEALMDPALGLSKEEIRSAFERWYSQEFIEPETLTQDQKKAKDLERELEKYRREEKERAEQTEREQQEKLTTQQREYLQNQIVEAMESSGLPKTKFFASRMAFYMRQNLLNGWDAPIDMIVRQVKNERQAMMSDLVQNSDAKALISLLGEEVITKIRQHDLEQLRERRKIPAPTSTNGAGVGPVGSLEKVSFSEVNRRLREMRKGNF
jgi:hypothetical protein